MPEDDPEGPGVGADVAADLGMIPQDSLRPIAVRILEPDSGCMNSGRLLFPRRGAGTRTKFVEDVGCWFDNAGSILVQGFGESARSPNLR